MKRVCHIVDELGMGGLEKTVAQIVLNISGYEHEIWCLKRKGILAQDLEFNGAKVREFYFEGRLSLPSVLRLIKELKKGRFDAIHSHGFFPSIWGSLGAIFSSIPVRFVHTQNLHYEISLFNKLKLKVLSSTATKIIVVSEAVKKCLVEFVGINPERIIVIYNCAPDLMLRERDFRLKESLGLSRDDFVVGNISRLEEQKGQAYLIEAMAAGGEDLKCLIVGDGNKRVDLEDKVIKLGLCKRVIFTGVRQDIGNLLSIMDIFVQPSTLREGLPLALAEAASAGLAIIATDIGGNPEIVKDTVNGFVVFPKDAQALAERIRHLRDNEQERRRMGIESRKIWQEKFTLESMIKALGQVYAEYI